jgi:hypothetical protein
MLQCACIVTPSTHVFAEWIVPAGAKPADCSVTLEQLHGFLDTRRNLLQAGSPGCGQCIAAASGKARPHVHPDAGPNHPRSADGVAQRPNRACGGHHRRRVSLQSTGPCPGSQPRLHHHSVLSRPSAGHQWAIPGLAAARALEPTSTSDAPATWVPCFRLSTFHLLQPPRPQGPDPVRRLGAGPRSGWLLSSPLRARAAQSGCRPVSETSQRGCQRNVEPHSRQQSGCLGAASQAHLSTTQNSTLSLIFLAADITTGSFACSAVTK